MRLGYISLPTVRNTQGIDLIVSSVNFSRTLYLQVKTNKNKYDFWIVGRPQLSENLFYVFVNLLSHLETQRPEYYIVPSKEVYDNYQHTKNSKKYENLTDQEKRKVTELVVAGKSAWRINEELKITVSAIRRVAQAKGLKIKYDRGKGEDFPFCFYIRKESEVKYKDRWDMLFP